MASAKASPAKRQSVGKSLVRPRVFLRGWPHFFSSAVQLFTKVKSDIDPPPIGIGKSMRLPSRVM